MLYDEIGGWVNYVSFYYVLDGMFGEYIDDLYGKVGYIIIGLGFWVFLYYFFIYVKGRCIYWILWLYFLVCVYWGRVSGEGLGC